MMPEPGHVPYRTGARWRLTLSYVAFLLLAGTGTLVGVYVVLRYVPDYPLTAADPGNVGVATTSRGQILAAVVRSSVYVLGTLLVIGTAGGWWLAGRVLRPLNDLHRAARIVATGRLNHRVRLEGPRDEFAEVADAFDLMLDRLSDAFAAQERFSANAAHELRTPLAVSRTILDVTLAGPPSDDRKALARLSQTTDRAIGLTEALLRLADVNELSARREPLDVSDVANDALSTVGAEATEQGIVVDASIAAARTVGDTPLLRQLVVNLLQNAIRHNRPDGRLWVSVGTGAEGARIEIQNDGEALDPQQVGRLAEPYLRGAGRTASRGQRQSGHGLGLALADRIVAVHHGRLTLEARPEGGLRVVVVLPATPTAHDLAIGRTRALEADRPANAGTTRKRTPVWLFPGVAVGLGLSLIGGLVAVLLWDGVTFPAP